nr:MAG TPA: replisome organizer [Caudoviricetes sp.]
MRDSVKIFRSFRDAAAMIGNSDLENGVEIAYQFLMAVLDYGLDGKEPELTGAAASMWLLTKPNLDISIKKAEAGAKGGGTTQASDKQTASKPEANVKQTPSTPEANRKQTASKPQADIGIGNRDKGIGNRDITPKAPKGADFDVFWLNYPKKVGKDAARKAFSKVKVPVETLLSAIEQQKCSRQWQEDGGQYIPNPATWLNQGRWQDELPRPEKPGWEDGRRQLDADEAAAIRRMFGGEPL